MRLLPLVFVPLEVAFNAPDWPYVAKGTTSYLGTAWPTPTSVRVIQRWDPPRVWANFLYVADRFCDAVFMSDILLTFNLGVFDSTVTILETRRPVLAWNYVGGYAFWLDVVSTIPYDLIVNSNPGDAGLSPLKTLRVLKLLRMARAYRVIARLEEQSALSVAHIRLAKYVTALLFLYHWLACGLQAVTGFEARQCNWVSYVFNSKYGVPACDPLVIEPTAAEVYTEALLWVIGRNPNVVVMQTNGEKTYAMCALVVIECFFAYIVAALFNLIQMLGKRTRAFDESFDELNLFIERKRVPRELSIRLRTYFRMQRPGHSDTGALDSWEGVLSSMPTVLRAEVVDQIGGGREITVVSYFRYLPSNLVLQLALDMKHITFPASEVLIRRGDDARAGSLMIVRKGVVISQSLLTTTIIPSSFKTVVLGEEALWPGLGRVNATATSMTRCEVHQLSVAHLLGLLGAFPEMVVQSVMSEGRRRWIRYKVDMVVSAMRGVKRLIRARHTTPGAASPNFMELLDAAEGHKAEVQSVRNKSQDSHSSIYALAPEIAMLVLANLAPREFEVATNAATHIQRAFRSWRNRRKQTRLMHVAALSRRSHNMSLTGLVNAATHRLV